MSFDPISAVAESTIGGVFDLGKMAIERLWPDPIKRAEEMRKLEQMMQNGKLEQMKLHVQLILAQVDVNKVEAKHKSIFVAGWRPAVGWIGAISLGYQFILYPLLVWIWFIGQASGFIPVELDSPPILDTDALFVILTGMLGIGGMRSFDKTKGTQTDKI